MKLSSSISKLKSEAKKISKVQGISHLEVLNKFAKQEGFESWSLLAHKFREQEEETLAEELPEEITELPLTGVLRREAVKTANDAFATALGRMEAKNPRAAQKLWDAEDYVDSTITEDMLPISTDYALHLVEVFLVMDAAEAAAASDELK